MAKMNSEKPPQKLNFRPVTDGLGFHPFSDGLPYAPVSKAQSKVQASAAVSAESARRGAGAMSAGPARVAIPKGPAPKVQVPTVRPTAGVMKVGQVGQVGQAMAIPREAPIIAELPARLGFGFMLRRTLAYLLDSTLDLGLCTVSFMWVMNFLKIDAFALFSHADTAIFAGLFLLSFHWALITAQEVAFGTTVGKRLFGIEMQPGSPLAIFLRSFFFLTSLGFGGLGLLWALFDSRRRCWHDVAMDLQPLPIASAEIKSS